MCASGSEKAGRGFVAGTFVVIVNEVCKYSCVGGIRTYVCGRGWNVGVSICWCVMCSGCGCCAQCSHQTMLGIGPLFIVQWLSCCCSCLCVYACTYVLLGVKCAHKIFLILQFILPAALQESRTATQLCTDCPSCNLP